MEEIAISFDNLPRLIQSLGTKIDNLQAEVTELRQLKLQTEEGEILTVDSAARILGIEKKTLYNWCSAGKIPFHKKPGGKTVWFLKSDLIAWVKAGNNG